MYKTDSPEKASLTVYEDSPVYMVTLRDATFTIGTDNLRSSGSKMDHRIEKTVMSIVDRPLNTIAIAMGHFVWAANDFYDREMILASGSQNIVVFILRIDAMNFYITLNAFGACEM